MSDSESKLNDHEQQLDAIIAEYYRLAEKGEAPDHGQFIARYPDFKHELSEFFADLNIFQHSGRAHREDTGLEPTIIDSTSLRKSLAEGAVVKYFGVYEILEELGSGGMGVVYKAKHARLRKFVALKMIRSGEFASDFQVKMFQAEARAAAKLDHPGIVAVHEVGLHAGQHFYSMDYVAGGSLSKLHRDEPIAARRAAELLKQIAEAIHYAHGQGIVHRDLKPANVLLTSNGIPRITDFGLAKRMWADEDSVAGRVTETGQVLGTAGYMSPEQAEGKTKLVGEPADIYSLGAVLYALLTSRAPFVGESQADTILQVIHNDPIAPRSLNPSVPRDLETICLKCLNKERHQRYGTAQHFADDLQRFLQGRPVLARPISRPVRVVRWCRRHPATAALTAGIAMSLVIGTLVSWSYAVQATTEKTRADLKADEALVFAKQAHLEKQRADAEADEARRNLYVARMNLAQAAWDDAHVGRVLELLKQYEPQPRAEDLRGFEWYYWKRLAHSYLLSVEGHKSLASVIVSVAFSPDGKRLASAGWDGTIELRDSTTGRGKLTLKGHIVTSWGEFWVNSVAFSPDGKRLVSTGGDMTVRVWDATSGDALPPLKGHTGNVVYATFSPDGKRLASASFDTTVKVWDVETGRATITFNGHNHQVNCVSFSPDGQRLASASHDNTVKVWDAMSGLEKFTLKGHTGAVISVAFSPNGKRLVSAGEDQTVKIWDATTGQDILTLKGHSSTVSCVAFSADGEWLATAGRDQTVRIWDATSGRETLTLKGHTGAVTSVTFSRDGKRLVSGSLDGTMKIWDATSVQKTLMLKGHTSAITCVAIGPDANWLASAGGDGDNTVKLWDIVSSQEKFALRCGDSDDSVRSMAFSRDGKRLLSASNDQLTVWDAVSGQELLSWKGHTYALNATGTSTQTHPVTSVAYSPDGKQLASASYDQTV